jgi:ubiquinone/menaquinone biosynthesis C-methylase UbiE
MPKTPFIPALRFHPLTRLYDPIVRLTTRETVVKGALVDGIGPAGPGRVLDLGSGTGTLLAMLRARYPEATLVGLDADPRIVRQAQRKVGAEVPIVVADATRPPFAPQSFDRVVSSLLFHHLTRPQKRAALEAVRSLLRPGGELHLADWGAPQDRLMRFAYLGVQVLDGFETTGDHPAGKLPTFAREAGFREVSVTRRERTPLGTMSILRAVA